MANLKYTRSKGISLLLAAIVLYAMTAVAQSATDNCRPAQVIPLTISEPPAKIFIDPPLPGPLASRGVAIIQYCAENLHLVPVFGPDALAASPRIGHVHVRLDDASWVWADESGNPIILMGLVPGPHKVLIESEDANHHTLDKGTVTFVVPEKIASEEHPASGHADAAAAPIYGITIPSGYRDWRLISVAREEGSHEDLRAILGNDAAFRAAREAKLPYPDGTIIARVAWSYDALPESVKAFGSLQSYVAGAPKNGVQFMVKDSRKYASTGGWGFAEFDEGKPAIEAVHKTCFSCHQIVKARDFVFNRYAP
jgi:hypothetical protein